MGKWIRKKDNKIDVKEDRESTEQGYELLMDIVDRKVFSVEDERVTTNEFSQLTQWLTTEYNKSGISRVSGRVIKSDPLVMVEVIGGEPVFVEIHDYKARYRVNVYQETEEVDIEVIEPVKTKELAYTSRKVPVLIL